MTCILIGLDGSPSGERAMAHAKKLAGMIGECELALAFVIDWSPYSFHTPEELEERHKRREEEIERAHAHVLAPAASALEADGYAVSTEVRHGDPASLLLEMAKSKGAAQIVVGSTGDGSLRDRIFGSVSGKLVSLATVPVTIVP
jgi:nucleotide-binding universal stress UspA family protein